MTFILLLRQFVPVNIIHMNRFLLQLSLLLLFSLTSCIREEALNSECDILEVDAQWLSSNGHKLVGKPIISNYSVELTVKEGVDYRLLEPQFVLSQGARIEKEDRITGNGESGIIKHYITYSADGKWSKSYNKNIPFPRGSVVKNPPANQEMHVSFLEKKMATHSSIPCLGNPMDRGAQRAIVHGVTEELDTT